MPLAGGLDLEPGLLVGRGHLAGGPELGKADLAGLVRGDHLVGRPRQVQVDHTILAGRDLEGGLELVPLVGVVHLD